MLWALMRAVGIAIPTGLTPSLPLMAIAVAGYSGRIPLNSAFTWLGTLVAVLVIALWISVDIFGDKLPGVRERYDRVKLVLCPLAGGIAAAAVYDATDIPWPVVFVIGAIVAGLVHVVKIGVRPRFETTPTARLLSPLVSLFLDVLVVVLAIVDLIFPPVSLVLGLLLLGGGLIFRRPRPVQA